MNIDIKQPSTKRGIVWIITSAIGLYLLITGQRESIADLLVLCGAVTGGLGLVNDKQ